MSLKPRAFDAASPALLAWLSASGERYLAVVDRIHDGDTYHALILTGFDTYAYQAIRMRGSNAPEITSPDPQIRARAVASRDHLAQLIPPGTVVVLAPERDVQSFTRYVAFTYDQPNHEVGQQMIADGFAVFLAGLPPIEAGDA